MIKGKAAYFVIGIVVISALLLRIFSKEGSWVCVDGSWIKQGNTNADKPTTSCSVALAPAEDETQKFILEGETATSTATTTEEKKTLALIDEPQANTLVSSPLVVKGRAPGSWYFEASFPVTLLDDKGNKIATTAASAESDPLTENFVPYSALLEFKTTATSGYLLLNNDNPSGLPENSLSVKIPVLFLNR
jgi:hypothetical protein